MSLEATRRAVLQLLKDKAAWEAGYGGGGVISLQELGEYGPAGMILEGAEFDKKDRKLLGESMDALSRCLSQLREERFDLWEALVEPYLADPADPKVVDRWREQAAGATAENMHLSVRDEDGRRHYVIPARGEKKERIVASLSLDLLKRDASAEYKLLRRLALDLGIHRNSRVAADWVVRHDAAIEWLATRLQDEDLYVAWASRMTSKGPQDVASLNDEVFMLYQRLRADNFPKKKAVETSAEMCGYSIPRVYEIVRLKEGGEKRVRTSKKS